MTLKTHSIGSQQVSPTTLVDIGGVTNAAELKLIGIDNGKAPRNTFEDPRPLLDGARRRGGVWGPRTGHWTILGSVMPAALTTEDIESVRDDLEDFIGGLLITQTGVIQLTVTREDTGGNPVSRILDVEPTEGQGMVWAPRDIDEGHVGSYGMPTLVKAFPWRAAFPWWRDEETTDTAELTLDATLRTTTITNPSKVPCGLAFNVEGSTAGPLDVTVLNATVGGNPAVVGAVGIVLQAITLGATNGHYVDQYVADPQRFQAYREADGTSIRDKLAPRPRLWLAPGVNTISYQITNGTPAGGETIQFFHRAWHNSP